MFSCLYERYILFSADEVSSSSAKKSFMLRPSALDKHTASLSPAPAGTQLVLTYFLLNKMGKLNAIKRPY